MHLHQAGAVAIDRCPFPELNSRSEAVSAQGSLAQEPFSRRAM
jgi:hypothetical protein